MPNWLETARKQNIRKARNYSHVEAQKRLNETIDPFHDQVTNALEVDSVSAIIFKKAITGRPCTCKKIPISEELDQAGNVPGETQDIVPQSSEVDGIELDLGPDDIFGEFGQDGINHGVNQSLKQKQAENKLFELADVLRNDTGADEINATSSIDDFETGLFSGSSINCGICYRNTVTPPYEPLNHTMYTLTNYDIRQVSAVTVDYSTKPATMIAHNEESWAKYTVNVPKYYKNVKFSIRDNLALIKNAYLYLDPQGKDRLSLAWLEENRGRTIDIYVVAEDFTHVMIFFETNANPLKVSISQENESLDYSRESTIGEITVIAPEKIGFMQNSDIIVIPERNLTLKVTEAPRKTTAQKTIIEWELSTRNVQTSEAIKNIYSGYKVY
jgi:hypothetical protein